MWKYHFHACVSPQNYNTLQNFRKTISPKFGADQTCEWWWQNYLGDGQVGGKQICLQLWRGEQHLNQQRPIKGSKKRTTRKETSGGQQRTDREVIITSCVGKTMERVVNKCLKWYLETNSFSATEHSFSATEQSDFRPFRSAKDQTTLTYEIEDAFKNKW